MNKVLLIIVIAWFHANFSFGFAIAAKGIFGTYGQPVHETISQKAAIDSGLIPNLNSAEMKSLIEGVRFNDDPEGFLSDDALPEEKRGVGAFLTKFIGFRKDEEHTDPTKAAHFGDYQYLHAMGKSSTNAKQIKNRILIYARHCWRIATEANSLTDFHADYEAVRKHLAFGDPDFEYTENQLIAKRAIQLFPKEVLFFHSRNQTQFRFRALGSLLHMIQDSYAKGHVVRIGWEAGDNSGDIRYFQDYGQQDSHQHGLLDAHPSGVVTPDNFFDIPGSKMAYQRSAQLLSLAANDCPWQTTASNMNAACGLGAADLINEVFAFEESNKSGLVKTSSHPDILIKRKDINETAMHAGGP